jgi:hypothetical protein
MSMNDPDGVSFRQSVGHLNCVIHGPARVETATGDHSLQRLAGDEFHRQKQHAVVIADFVHAGNAGMAERRQRRGVVEELLAASGIAGDVARDDLERDGATDFGVARSKEIADSAGADPVEQLVMADRVGHAARELYCRAESGPQGPPDVRLPIS